MKRCFDIIVSVIGLVLTAPLVAAIGAIICLTDGSPVLFRQRRVGWRGRRFSLYKFRTMSMTPRAQSGMFDAGDISRVTRVGRVLRKTKFDELPQLWNVLRGEMSLVGPRPELEQWVVVYPERWAIAHCVRPGITDPASVVYRHEEELLAAASDPVEMYRREILPRKLSLYKEYVRTQTMWRDLWIILQTLTALVTPFQGAK